MSGDFDREFALADLLPATLLTSYCKNLATLLDAPLALLDARQQPLWGEVPAESRRYPLVLELEPLGYLSTAADPARVTSAARLLVEYLMARRRYLMASALHTEVVAADFAEMRRQQEALQNVEGQLQNLSASLDQRVKEETSAVAQTQRQLYQSEKLASVAQLAAGVAHEINNPLGFVRSNLHTLGNYLEKINLLAERLGDAEAAWQQLDLEFVIHDGADLVNDCVTGLDRIARIVADLKGLSNIDRPEQTLLDINDGLHDACAVIDTRKPPGVTMAIDAGTLPQILCRPGYLNQVFMHVLTNALQAVGDSGKIDIQTRHELDSAGVGQIVIRIRDDGCGIEAANLPRIFDPFFTTRDVGQGTGLGLTVARDIVQAHNGTISVASSPGRGALVTIRLPA